MTLGDTAVYLMDNDGRIIHTWTIEETSGVLEAHLLENGNLVVVAGIKEAVDKSLMPSSGAGNGSIREYTWDGELVWEHWFTGAETHQHHAIDIMPNGNTLITEGTSGRLIEVRPDGEVVWEFVNPKTRDGLTRQGDPPNPDGDVLKLNRLFRVHKYPRDFPGFAGKDMSPGERLVD